MCEHDAPGCVERARGQIADEKAIVEIDIGQSDSGVDTSPITISMRHSNESSAQRIVCRPS